MNYLWLIIFVLYIILTHIVAKKIGEKRMIDLENQFYGLSCLVQ